MKIDNTFGINAEARLLITYDSEEALREALMRIHEQYEGLPILHIGCGSNLLFLNDYNGIVLKSNIKGIALKEETDDEVLVEAGAGEICDEFIAEAIHRGWYRMENLSLIPGQIGAAAVQNIGAYGVEVCDVIEEVKGISLKDGSEHIWRRDECKYGYRQSIFKEELWGKYAITRVTFRLSKHFEPKLQYGGLIKAIGEAGLSERSLTAGQLRQVIIDIRRAKLPDPKEQGNAGSFFKNPIVSKEKAGLLLKEYPEMPHYPAEKGVKLAAGWLIEQAGWKGRSLGPAAVHDHQALVLVNKGGATGHDIQRLCEAIKQDVNKRFGIELEPEVNFI
ncbi:MAG: UDP-N-acetylmuramate dehydrogenase [Bacteroidaceae bacterium]|nr:UDP-N-acetylmuramate dehydrogenase [Bacteroidaceae bacterium]